METDMKHEFTPGEMARGDPLFSDSFDSFLRFVVRVRCLGW